VYLDAKIGRKFFMANTNLAKKVQVLQPVLKPVLEGEENQANKKRV